ncbi:hypothetical protein GGI12_005352 [Dipsacomyces acuminosporus]|nr:hypothetical protein GGI12_005352 [Dipsacomyces acuminosporus]
MSGNERTNMHQVPPPYMLPPNNPAAENNSSSTNANSRRYKVGQLIPHSHTTCYILPNSYPHIVIKEPNTTEPKKGKRKRITPEQFKELTAVFEKTDTPTHDIREELAKKLSMTNREVQVWFQNRRAKFNRQRVEQQRQLRTNAAIMYSSAVITGGAPPQQPQPLPLPPPPPSVMYHHPQQHVLPQTFHLGANVNVNSSTAPHIAASTPAQMTHPQPAYPHASSRTHTRQQHLLLTLPHAPASAPIRPVISTDNVPSARPTSPVHYAGRVGSPAADASYRSYHHYLPPSLPVPQQPTSAVSASPYVDALRSSEGLSINVHAASAVHPLASAAPHTAPALPSYTNAGVQPALQSPEHPPHTSTTPLSSQMTQQSPVALATPTPAQYRRQQQPLANLDPKHLQSGRRNTVSGPTSPYNASKGTVHEDNNSISRYSPTYNHSTLDAASQDNAVVATTPTQQSININALNSNRYSTLKSPSPSHYNNRNHRHYPYPLSTKNNSNGTTHTPSSATASAVSPSAAKPAMATRSSANISNDGSATKMTLPPIRNLLANAESNGISDERGRTDPSSADNASLQTGVRARSHTSPAAWQCGRPAAGNAPITLPPIRDSSPPPPPLLTPEHEYRSLVPMSYRSPPPEREQVLDSPRHHHHSSYFEDTQMRDAKLGIDVLASAAISVSSAMSNHSLPHLTPLSDLAPRSSSSQYQTSQGKVPTPPLQPVHPADLQQHPHSSGEEGPPRLSVRKLTPVDSTMQKRSNWRPW